MIPPEKSPSPKRTELLTKQVPWGAAKLAAKPAPPEPAKANLSAKKVPWSSRKPTAPAPPPGPLDPTVTHMPWAAPEPAPTPASPPPAAPIVSAKRVPWSWRKTPKPGPPPAEKIAEVNPALGATAWALPRDAAAAALAQTEMELARDSRPPDDNEPTAEQLVALLSKLPRRTREPQAMSTALDARAPYKARPISFEPTSWEVFTLWAYAFRRRLSIGGVLFVLALATAYLLRLVSLNAEIDRQWRALETALRDRYALVPAYVDCIQTYSDNEPFTFTMAQKGLTAWRSARTEEEFVAAAAQMERVLNQLTRVMTRYEQDVPAKDPDQADSSAAFARLERQKERSRRLAGELVQRYNATVENFNAKVQAVPGSWIAWAAHLDARRPIFANG